MGRRKSNADSELTFAPKLSKTSKRIALRLSDHLDTKGVPRFMRETKSKKITLEPITSVSLTHRSITSDQPPNILDANDLFNSDQRAASRPTLASLDPELLSATEGRSASKMSSTTGFAESGSNKLDPFNNAMSKNVYLAPKSLQLDESVFSHDTNPSSATVTDNLGTDISAHQQMLLKEQKHLVS